MAVADPDRGLPDSAVGAAAAHDTVLCDRSVLDNYCYLVQAAGSLRSWDQFLDYWLPTYDLLVKVPITQGQPGLIYCASAMAINPSASDCATATGCEI